MFYNAHLWLVNRLWFILINVLLLFEYTFNNVNFEFNTTKVSDSSILLYTLSSSTLTWWSLSFLIGYFYMNKTKRIKLLTLIIYFYFTKYFIEKQDNVCFVWNWLFGKSVNVNLQNGLLNIHPPLIYYLYGICIIIWVLFFYNKNLFNYYIQNDIKILSILNLTIVGIILGSLWAVQELNWGGFWSWDPVELSSLLLFFYLLVVAHTKLFDVKNLKPVIILLLYLFVIYCLVRSGVVNTIHSFVRSFQLPLYIYVITFFIIQNIYHFLTKYSRSKHKILPNLGTFNKTRILIYLIKLCAYLLLSYLCVLIIVNIYNIVFIVNIGDLFYKTIIVVVYSYLIIFFFLKPNWRTYLILIYILCLFTKTCILFFVLITLFTLYNYMYTITHISYFFFYFLNHYFLSSNAIYCGITYSVNSTLVCAYANGFYVWFDQYFELLYSLNKKVLIKSIKDVYQHIVTFNINTNPIMSVFSLSKNGNIYHLFSYAIVLFYLYSLLIITYFVRHNYIFFNYTKVKKTIFV